MTETEPQPAVPKPMLRWYRLTSNRLVLVFLAVECLLWLSDRFRWLPWHKGYAVLSGVASSGVGMLLIALWFALDLLFRGRFQFRIRALLVLVGAVAIPSTWLAVEMRAAERQKAAVERMDSGLVVYDYEWGVDGNLFGDKWEPGPSWLRPLLGIDFFANVETVLLPSFASADDLQRALKLFPTATVAKAPWTCKLDCVIPP